MGVYNDSVQKYLDSFPERTNPLYKYDNYTYHIEFYMVESSKQKEYEYIKSQTLFNDNPLDTTEENSKNAYDAISSDKIIIAESGTTDDIFIDSLSIKSCPAFSNIENLYCASEEFILKIKETAGISLVNYIHLATQLAGYFSYINTPYFLTISFKGYNNTDLEKPTDDIGEKINQSPYKFTYQVIIENVETQQDINETVYTLTLRPYTDIGLQKNNAYIMDTTVGKIEAGKEYGYICQSIVDKKNQEMRDLLGEDVYKQIYGSIPPLSMEFKKLKDANGNDILKYFDLTNYSLQEQLDKRYYDINDQFKEKLIDPDRKERNAIYNNLWKQTVKDVSGSFNDYAKSREEEGWWSVGPFMSLSSSVKGLKTIGQALLYLTSFAYLGAVDAYVGTTNMYKEFVNKPFTEGEKEYANRIITEHEGTTPYQIDFSSNGKIPIYNFISELFYLCYPLKGYIPTINVVPTRLQDYNNETYYSVKYIVEPLYFPLLEKMQKSMYDRTMQQNFLGPKEVEQNQLDYYKWCLANNTLFKKYTHYLSGTNTDVLSCDTKEDNFWYLNNGENYMVKAIENTQNINPKDIEKIFDDAQKKRDAILTNVRNVIQENKNHGNKKINMIDLVSNTSLDVLKDLRINCLLPMKIGSEAIIKTQQNSSASSDNKENISQRDKDAIRVNTEIKISKIAAENMLSTDQRNEFRIKILGDPYWLTFSSEDIQIPRRSLPHLILHRKAFTKLDGNYDYKEDKLMEFSSLYRVTDITTNFYEGKFEQDLHGYIATPFAVGKQMPDEKKLTPDQERTLKVLEDNKGNIFNVDQMNAKINEKSPVFKKDDKKYSSLDIALNRDKIDESVENYNKNKKSVVFK